MKPWRRAKRWRSGRKARSQKKFTVVHAGPGSVAHCYRGTRERSSSHSVDAAVQSHRFLVCCAALRVPLWVQSVQNSAGGSDSEQLVTRSRRPFTGRCVPERAHARGGAGGEHTHTHRDETARAAGWVCHRYCTFCSLLFLQPGVQFTNERHIFIRQPLPDAVAVHRP